jgi:hypothetical protein
MKIKSDFQKTCIPTDKKAVEWKIKTSSIEEEGYAEIRS